METSKSEKKKHRFYDIPEESITAKLVDAYLVEHLGHDVIHIDGDEDNKEDDNVIDFNYFDGTYSYDHFIMDYFYRENQWQIQELLENEVEKRDLKIQSLQKEIIELKNRLLANGQSPNHGQK